APYGKLIWTPGTLDRISNSPELIYEGAWGMVKRIQRWMKKSMAPAEKFLLSMHTRKPLRTANWMTSGLVDQWRQSDITIATHSFTAHAAALLSGRTRAFYHMQGYE